MAFKNLLYFFKSRNRKLKLLVLLVVLTAYYFCLPTPLFKKPYATVIESDKGRLIGAKIALDGQWRFPERNTVPYKFKQALLLFEDEYFYKHWGVNPISMAKAFYQNQKKGRIVRGGSTLTQQVIRLSRNKRRSYFEKLIESILATRLEFRFSKDKILALYSSHAPFGGNVVGLDMASWRYFGTSAEQLSWAESAMLAVLPNAPRLIYPGKNQKKLLKKRNALLKKLWNEKVIDRQTYLLAIEEPLPQKPHLLPKVAPHLVERMAKKKRGKRTQTSIRFSLQQQVNNVAKKYYDAYRQSKIYNLAILVIEVKTGKVLSYVGNSPTNTKHQKNVDIITAPRSTGSILKPFLYATMLDEGELLPKTLIPDIPTYISGYTPQNFNLSYEGAVNADKALAKSLNIPFVLLLQEYSVYRFYEKLQKLRLSNITKHPTHYGLSLILGGAESNLWDLCRAYTFMASTLNNYNKTFKYAKKEVEDLHFEKQTATNSQPYSNEKKIFSAGAIWHTFEAMKELNRPEGDEAWRYYNSSRKIAWKTGTSFGNKDAWAIGVTPSYVVGVWVGNATGEGRPSLTGVSNAAPIMFSTFNLLPKTKWFDTPYEDLKPTMVCEKSGCLAGENCPSVSKLIVANTKKVMPCTYHKKVHLDATQQYQVTTQCESLQNIVTKKWFVLPPISAFFYKKHHLDYVDLPPFKEGCFQGKTKKIDFIYPKHNSQIYLPKGFGGKKQSFVAKVAYPHKKTVFWYLDRHFLGSTQHFHEKSIQTTVGVHYLKVLNELGEERTIKFEVKE